MSEQTKSAASDSDVPREEWASWCESATEQHAGRELELYFADDAIGKVKLAEGQKFVAIEHDELGSAVAFTVRYGEGVVVSRHVIAEPQVVTQSADASGTIQQVRIVDSTNRHTFLGLI